MSESTPTRGLGLNIHRTLHRFDLLAGPDHLTEKGPHRGW